MCNPLLRDGMDHFGTVDEKSASGLRLRSIADKLAREDIRGQVKCASLREPAG